MKIISGGQTGVDIAALDVARNLGLPWGGWAPRGWICEDGLIPDHYRWDGHDINGLMEDMDGSPNRARHAYVNRTERNIIAANFTIIYYKKQLTGGTLLTKEMCKKLNKHYTCIDIDENSIPISIGDTAFFLHLATALAPFDHTRIINVAGPRASKHPDIYNAVFNILYGALRPMFIRS